jgi:hypothetical protein
MAAKREAVEALSLTPKQPLKPETAPKVSPKVAELGQIQ